MEISGISPVPAGPEYRQNQAEELSPESEKLWEQHLSDLGLNQEQTALYQGLLLGLSEGALTKNQAQSLENLLKKLFNLKNVYLQNS